jgi:hypothetical protein
VSSAARIELEPDEEPILLSDWQEFCAEYQIEYSQQTVGGNTYYAEGPFGVECKFGEPHYADTWQENAPPAQAHRLSFSTFYGGPHCPGVIRHAVAAWKRWGGALTADEELRGLIAGEQSRSATSV